MNLLILAGILLLVVLGYLIWRENRPKQSKTINKAEAERIIEEKLFIPKEVTKGAKRAPIAGKCYECGERVAMPYKCKFCGGLYCDQHRLPEAHSCIGLKKLRRERNKS